MYRTKPKIKLSIIIVNWDTVDLTLACIRSVYQFAPDCPFEIILIDNGSQEAISDEDVEVYPEVRLIRTGENLGFSRANNLGIYNAEGEFIVLLNSDTCIIEPTFDYMINYMKQNPNVGVLGAREVDGEGRFRLSCGSFPTFFSELTRKIWHYRLSLNDYNLRDHLDTRHGAMKDVDWVSGSCMMLRRKALEEVGLLDESFFMYFEDIDLCTRSWRKKWEVHYFPHTSLVHYGGCSARKNLMKVITEYRYSEIYFARKYYGWVGGFLIRLFLFLKYSAYFLKEVLVFFCEKMMKKNTTRSYTVTLLSKKVLQAVFLPSKRTPIEPVLKKRSLENAIK